jgi:hypothetical protein
LSFHDLLLHPLLLIVLINQMISVAAAVKVPRTETVAAAAPQKRAPFPGIVVRVKAHLGFSPLRTACSVQSIADSWRLFGTLGSE